jgi:hypothetical protein
MQLTLSEAQLALKAQQNSTRVLPVDVKNLLAALHGTTFAQITQVTPVKTAAAFKDVDIRKITVANVQLFNHIHDFNSVYEDAVKRSAKKLGINTPAEIKKFESSENWFEHLEDCFSLVRHKTKQEQHYLFAMYNGAESVYLHNNQLVDKNFVAGHLTPAEAKKLLEPPMFVENKTNGVFHDVVVRVISLDNMVAIQAMKDILLV